jgi:hypothetical protein
MALVTASQLALQLGVSEANGNLTRIAAAVSSAVVAYLGWNPETSSYTEYLDGTGGNLLTLDSPPVPIAVTAVYEDRDKVFGSDTLLTADDDYSQRKNGTDGLGVLVRLGTTWPYAVRGAVGRLAGTVQHEQGCVKCTYTTTNTDALAAAQQAARIEGAALYNLEVSGAGLGIVTSDSMDGASVSVQGRVRPGQRPNSRDGFVSPYVAGMLDVWAKIRVAR